MLVNIVKNIVYMTLKPRDIWRPEPSSAGQKNQKFP
jgi:hypothetical protein